MSIPISGIKNELVGLVSGYEAVSASENRAFTGVQLDYYWSSTSGADGPGRAWHVDLRDGYVTNSPKTFAYYVWPVRGGQ